jgi:RNA polymerase sigma-70 factor (ECF subfamily)
MTDETGAGSFEAAVLPHLDAAHNLARWLMRSPDTAQDVVQEAVMRALAAFPRFRGVNPRAWLLTIVRNAAYTSMKLNRGLRLVPLQELTEKDGDDNIMDELQDPADDPERSLMRDRDRQTVAGLLDRLPVELREAVILRELDELSYKEIAQITDTPIGTVMSRLWRARQLLAASAQMELKKA